MRSTLQVMMCSSLLLVIGCKARCQKWASAAYADTHFSEPSKLRRLAGETKHDCEFFAGEIVDEGGLPTARTES